MHSLGSFRDCRKLMRLFTSVVSEFGKIKRISRHLKWTDMNRKGAKGSFIISRTCYALFFLLDNLHALTKANVMSFLDRKKLSLYSFFFWFLGLLTSFSYNTFLLRISYELESNLKHSVINNKTPKQAYDSLVNLSKERQMIYTNLLRNFGDIAIAVHEMQLPKRILKTNFNNGLVAVCGMLSSAIGMFQCYQKVRKNENAEYDLFDRGE